MSGSRGDLRSCPSWMRAGGVCACPQPALLCGARYPVGVAFPSCHHLTEPTRAVPTTTSRSESQAKGVQPGHGWTERPEATTSTTASLPVPAPRRGQDSEVPVTQR